MADTKDAIAAAAATLGRKGGKASGSVKVRGDADYYRRLQAQRKRRKGGRTKVEK